MAWKTGETFRSLRIVSKMPIRHADVVDDTLSLFRQRVTEFAFHTRCHDLSVTYHSPPFALQGFHALVCPCDLGDFGMLHFALLCVLWLLSKIPEPRHETDSCHASSQTGAKDRPFALWTAASSALSQSAAGVASSWASSTNEESEIANPHDPAHLPVSSRTDPPRLCPGLRQG